MRRRLAAFGLLLSTLLARVCPVVAADAPEEALKKTNVVLGYVDETAKRLRWYQASDYVLLYPVGARHLVHVVLRDGWRTGRYAVRLRSGTKGSTPSPFASAQATWFFDLSVPPPEPKAPLQTASVASGPLIPGGQSLLWQGMWADPVTGLYMTHNRVYDPRTASFLSPDPADDWDSPNLYGFVAQRGAVHVVHPATIPQVRYSGGGSARRHGLSQPRRHRSGRCPCLNTQQTHSASSSIPTCSGWRTPSAAVPGPDGCRTTRSSSS